MPLTKKAYKKLNDNTDGIRFIRPFSEYTLQEVIEALNELEELKRDVARYFVLLDKYTSNTQTIEEMHERWTLEEILKKAGILE